MNKNLSLKQTILAISGAIVIIIIFIAVTVVDTTEPEKVGEAEKEQTTETQPQETEKPSIKTHKLGDEVELEGKILAVHSVSPHNDKLFTPEKGNKFIALDLTLRNSGKEPFNYNVLEFELQDNENYKYTNSASDKNPYLTVGVIQPGQNTRGFIVYEIPESNKPTKLIYTPDFFSLSQVIIELN